MHLWIEHWVFLITVLIAYKHVILRYIKYIAKKYQAVRNDFERSVFSYISGKNQLLLKMSKNLILHKIYGIILTDRKINVTIIWQ